MAKASNIEEYHKAIKENIERDGIHLTGVYPDEKLGSPQFVYSIGAPLSDIPEMITFFPSMRTGPYILNTLFKMMRDEGLPIPTEETEVPGMLGADGEFGVILRPIDKDSIQYETLMKEYMIGSHQLFGDPDVLQVIIPDLNGVYPDKTFCDKVVRDNTPLLFR